MSTIERIQHEQSQLRAHLDRPPPGNIILENVPTIPVARCAKIKPTAAEIAPPLEWHADWTRILRRQDEYSPAAAAKTFDGQQVALAKDPSADPSEFRTREEIEKQFAAIREALSAAQHELQRTAPARCEALVRRLSKALHARVAEVEKFETSLAEDLGIEFEPSRTLKRLRMTAQRFDENIARPHGFHPHHMFEGLIDFEKGVPCK